MPTNATAVSRNLRRAGFVTSFDRKRQGIRVSNGYGAGRVRVSADLDGDAEAIRLAQAMVEPLTEAGYTVEYTGGKSLYVTREGE